MAPLTGVEIVEQGEPYTAESVQMLCLSCVLPACDETNRNCLIWIARRRDHVLHRQLYFEEWLAAGGEKRVERRKQLKRESDRRRRARQKENECQKSSH